jgi:GT2 family glycosyltransferase
MARGEYIAFLNTDMRVDKQWLRELVNPCLSESDVVCTASKILDWEGKTIDFADAAMNFMGWGCQPHIGSRRLQRFTHDKDVLFACGGAMVIRRDLFLEIGGFDAEHFAYFEDVDLGWRLRLLGYKVRLAARAITYHRQHGSWGSVSDAKKIVLYERNALRNLIKNYDETSLARVLPAALLLLLQRAYLEIHPDPALFTTIAPSPPPDGPVFGLRYYAEQIHQMLQAGTYAQLAQRMVDELGRRGQQVYALLFDALKSKAKARPLRQAIGDQMDVPAIALSRLVVGRELLRSFATLLTQRRQLQTQRLRADSELFPLFQWALQSNFNDAPFIRAMQVALTRFGITNLVKGESAEAVVCEPTQTLSYEVCLQLLRVMDYALTLSGVQESHFQLSGPPPETEMRVPLKAIAPLAEVHKLLWTLPNAPLAEVLQYLSAGCQKILQTTSVTP